MGSIAPQGMPEEIPPRLPNSVCDLFQRHVKAFPGRIAVSHGDSQLTYRELEAASARIAMILQKRGVKPRDCVPILTSRCPEMVACLLAIVSIGACYVPVDVESWSPERIHTVLSVISAKVIIATDVKPSPHNEVTITGQEIHDAVFSEKTLVSARPSLPIAACKEDPAYTIFTSGTTGMPKGVQIANESLLHFVQHYDFGITPVDKVLVLFSIAFDAYTGAVFCTLGNGGHLMLSDSETFMRDAGLCTVLPCAPSLLDTLQEPDLYNNIHTICMGGESPSPHLIRKWWSPSRRILNAYGPTETTIAASQAELKPELPISLGRPMNGCQMLLLDSNLEEALEGEIYIGGPIVGLGYYQNEALTKEKFIHWNGTRLYRTSDFGRRTSDGISFLCRKDSLVKNRGFLINLEVEVIPALLENTEVYAATAFMHHQKLVAYVIPECVDVHDLRLKVSSNHDTFHVPDLIKAVSSFPLTSSGKVDVKALRKDLDLEVVHSAELSSSTDTPLGYLRSAISLALNLPLGNIAEDVSFWELGGNSLAAIKLLSLLHERQLSINLERLYLLPSIVAISEELHAIVASATSPSHSQEGVLLCNTRQEPRAPITNVQMGMIRSSLQESLTAYILVSINFETDEQIFNSGQWKDAWEIVLARHSIFRTSFDTSKGTQIAEGSYAHDWEETIVATDQLESVINQESDALLALSKYHGFEPLFSPANAFRFIRAPGSKSTLLWLVHHSQIDGWSFGILISEVRSIISGQTLPQPPQFYIFAKNLELHIKQQRHTSIAFWSKTLKGFLEGAPLNLPKPESKNITTEPSSTSVDLNLSVLDFEEKARNLKVSPAAVIYGAWAMVLATYSAKDRVVFGTVFSGRNFPIAGVEKIVGPMINTCPFPVALNGIDSKSDLLNRVQTQLLQISDHQWSAAEALEEIASGSHARIYDTILFLEYDLPEVFSESEDEKLGQFNITRKDMPEFGLTILVEASKGHFTLRALSQRSLYDGSVISRMLKHFRNLIQALLDSRCQDLPSIRQRMLDPPELHSLTQNSLSRFDEYHGPKNLKQSLERAADAWPSHVAVESTSRSMTYSELDRTANFLAKYIAQIVYPGEAVALVSDGSLNWLIGVISIIKSGAIYVPLDTKLPSQRMEIITKTSDAKLCIVPNQECEGLLAPDSVPLLSIHQILRGAPSQQSGRLQVNIKPADWAYVIFTSGSTGVPKGVRVNHHAVLSYLSYEPARMHAAPGRRHAQMFSAGFDVNIAEIFGTLCYGATLVLKDPSDPYAHLKRIDATMITPSFLSVCSPDELSNLDTILFAGEAVPQALSDRWSGDRRLYNSYGPCECTIGALFKLLQPGERVTLGRAIPRVGVYLLDTHSNPVPIGVTGEICLSGLQVMDGYIGAELKSQTDARFVPDPFLQGHKMYRTGDLAVWTEDMELRFLGRIDNQVKVRGYRVELEEIENAILSACPTATHAAALIDDGNIAAFVAPGNIDTALLQQRLRGQLPSYACPASIISLPHFPTTPNQKLDRKALKGMAATIPRSLPSARSKQVLTKTQSLIERIWRETIGLSDGDEIELDDDFMALGGNSLRQIKAAQKISADISLSIPLSIFIRNTKMSALATALDEFVVKESPKGDPFQSFLVSWKSTSTSSIRVSRLEEEIYELSSSSATPQSFNVPYMLELRGNVDLEKLERAINAVVNRNAIFRTFYERRGSILRRSISMDPVSIERISMARRSGEALQRVSRDLVDKPFDLSKEHPIRIALLEHDSHITLIVAMHHIITDKTSCNILFKKIQEHYTKGPEAAHRVRSTVQEPSYAEWADWDRAKTHEIPEAHFHYWKEHLRTLTRRPFTQTSESVKGDASNCTFDVSIDSVSRSSFEYCLSILALTLKAVIGTTDILLAIPYIDRSEHGTEDMFGIFLDRLPIRIQLDHFKDVPSLVSATKEGIEGALSHSIPYREIRKIAGDNALFDVMVTYNRLEDSATKAFQLPGVRVTEAHYKPSGSKFPLLVEFTETEEGVSCELEYSTVLVSEVVVNGIKAVMPAISRFLKDGTPLDSLDAATCRLLN
ncbi:putative non-ribosomal peptide synthetase SirP/GliP2 [Mytilinidion resinicola]|uniref:Non-ribosomal peptide synthetase SirP/GliP2 n=1 Tax=Mytilinidion resinicola TaxID=574789 RepID=A0A6A6Z3A8_9PEZI|nr:putative non-ribosomal peptide synthetase SirP/GliP2 [Mytilinidion resinicola]KAF2815490.1 putative non-ribosomal peptide synthetase SirP/GliP2 [Mytilinidion resinicola]